ncbi:MAG: hypothetical protein IJT42_09180 [Treponema sp.]|nr:hypothetical protein [Treponema sp.]
MKKHNLKTKALISIFFGLLVAPLFFSCDGIIFHEIRNEVELADAKLSGDIQNIVRYNYGGKECIFASKGDIYYRSVDSSVVDKKMEFSDFPTPNEFVYSLAADTDNLYALSVKIEKDDDGYNVAKNRTLWYYNTTTSAWESIWTADYNKNTTVILFCTNTPKKETRHAYFRNGTTADNCVYELNGSEKPGDGLDAMENGSTDHSTSPTTGVRSCTVLGSDVYFSSAYAMVSNQTANDDGGDATYIYRSDGKSVQYSTDGSSWTSVSLGGDTIYSLAVCKDYLLAGTYSGLIHTKWTSTDYVPTSGNQDFETNAASTLSSYYEIQSIVVVDPSQIEKSATIFASSITSSSSVSLNNVGLWSYFLSEGKWNRE